MSRLIIAAFVALLVGAGIGFGIARLIASPDPASLRGQIIPPSVVLKAFDPEGLVATAVPGGAMDRQNLAGGQDRASRLHPGAGYLFGKHAMVRWKGAHNLAAIQKKLWQEALTGVRDNGGEIGHAFESQEHSWAPYEVEGVAGVVHLWTVSVGERHTIALSIHETPRGSPTE